MPGRQSHGGPPSKQSRSRVNNKKRSINAFAIAAQQNPESIKIRQHRFGDIEGDDRRTKRARTGENLEGDGGTSNAKQQREKAVKGRFDEPDIDAGSDSDGNEWRMGHVDNGNDSDLDSDEAFGESDEERFDGFAFSGSSTKSKVKRHGKGERSRDVTLSQEYDNSEMESASDNGSLGDEAVDLAAMLDVTEEYNKEDNKDLRERDMVESAESEAEASNSDTENSYDISTISSTEENDDDDPEKITALQNLVAGLPQAEDSKAPLRQRSDGTGEYNTPSDFGIVSKSKLTLEDLGLPSIRDPFVRKSLKLLAPDPKGDSLRKGISRKLEVPLAKRQQDRLDRSAAYEKSKETLDRWTDTVKHNRRAEHLIFPLPDVDAASANVNARLQPTTNSKPFNELEATIKTILEESGLAAANGKDGEDKIMEFEELEKNKMSLEEVKARRAQLRIARDLLFREEARAKRIKKIKSKSYRKVHRKQREKENQLNKQALIEAGVEPSEDEQELRDRRRAEERMGAKHRDSKWAKATKQAGRAAWDEDARAGITEMARRDEELRKRIEGRASRNDIEAESEFSDSDFEDESAGDEDAVQAQLLRKLEDVKTSKVVPDSGPGSKLANLKFMLKAEASRRKENDATIEQIRKDLADESSSNDEGNDLADIGRRTFGPGSTQSKAKDAFQIQKSNDFEEPEDSNEENDVEIHTTLQSQETTSRNAPNEDHRPSKPRYRTKLTGKPDPPGADTGGGGAWSRAASQKDISWSQGRKQKQSSAANFEELDISNTIVIAKPTQPKKKLNAKLKTLQTDDDDDDNNNDEDDTLRLPYAIRDQDLIKRAFAGADVVGEFEAEKQQVIMEEDVKIIDNTLPGWGNWIGDGVSKKDKRQNRGRFLTMSEGIKEQDRKDAKLDRVIINEKRVKKVSSEYAPRLTLSDLYRMANILRPIFPIHLKLVSNTKDP
jgi:U3 small nucleolar RNA-associated protein 14